MFIILTFLLNQVFCDQSGTLRTNKIKEVITETEKAKSLLVRFKIYDENVILEDYIACIVSNENFIEQSLTIDQLVSQPNSDSNIYYDYQSIQLKYSTQLVELKFTRVLYMLCQTQAKNYPIIKYEIFPSQNDEPTCLNDCNGYNYPEIQQSICINHFCFCQDAHFGNFCQFKSLYLLADIETQASIKQDSWQYFTYQYDTKELALWVTDENRQLTSVKFALVVKSVPQLLVPLKQNLQFVNGTINLSEIITLQENLATNSKDKRSVIYIAFYNDQKTQLSLRIRLQILNHDDGMESTNLIVIIVTGCIVGGLLLLSFVVSFWKTRQQQEIDREREQYIQQVRQELQHNIAQTKNHKSGFSHQFIREYFKAYKYSQLIVFYPKLKQFEECIICLEQLNNECQTHLCGVMPCFHIFHHGCLAEWLSKQRACPLCRAYYHRKSINQAFPWVILQKVKVTLNEDASINLTKTNQTTIQNNINESQVDFVQKLEESSYG